MKYNKRANHFLWGSLALEAALLLIAACLVAPTPPVLAQDNESAVMQAIENAMPKLSELPAGWTWDTSFAKEDWETQGTEKIFHQVWIGKKSEAPNWESELWIVPLVTYDTSAVPWPSPEAFRSAILMGDGPERYNVLEGAEPYEGLPGGVIWKLEDEVWCIIAFWKSPDCYAHVGVDYSLQYVGKDFATKVLSESERQYRAAKEEEAATYVVSTCEQLAQLVWSRLPEGSVGAEGETTTITSGTTGTTTALIPPVTTTTSTGGISDETSTVTPEDEEQSSIPDTALPIATGAAAGLAALGALATALAQGIPPGEAISELAGLFRGKVPQAEDIEYQQAWEDFRAEQAKYEYSSADYSGDQMAKVKADMAAEAAGTISDFDKMRLKLWIANKSPSDQAYDDMLKLADEMTLKTGDGKTIGDINEIYKALMRECQRTDQPYLTYNEKFALRDEVMEKAPVLGKAREIYSDATGVISAAHEIGKFEDARFKGADMLGKISDSVKYVEGYTAAGNSTAMAITKAGTQMGIKMFVTNNPVISLGDTTLKYIGQATIGKDISPSKGAEIIVNRVFDSITGELDRKPIEALDFGSSEIQKAVCNSQINGIQKQMKNPNLTGSERETLSQLLSQLQTKLQEM